VSACLPCLVSILSLAPSHAVHSLTSSLGSPYSRPLDIRLALKHRWVETSLAAKRIRHHHHWRDRPQGKRRQQRPELCLQGVAVEPPG
jgi:hypothetical protein